jgi:hypothetical protein
MKQIHTERNFVMIHRSDVGDVSRQAFDSCFFDNCSLRSSPGRFTRVREVDIRNCRQRACTISDTILEDVLVDGFSGEGDMPLFLQGVRFRRVTLQGRITQFKINPTSRIVDWSSPEARTALADQSRFYADVDWALDIRNAKFTFGPDLHFIPGRLVRFDPASQALVRRDALENADLDSLPWNKSAFEIGIRWFLRSSPYSDTVIVAPTKGRGFRRDLEVIAMLRDRGLAEPSDFGA